MPQNSCWLVSSSHRRLATGCRLRLVIDTEERSASLALLRTVVDELVQAEKVRLGSAVNVVPPVADEVLLIEDGPIRAEEGCGATVLLAHVERLAVGCCVRVDAGQVLLLPTIEPGLWHFCEHWVVCSSFAGNGIHHHLSIRTDHVLQGDPHSQRGEVRKAIGEALNWGAFHLTT